MKTKLVFFSIILILTVVPATNVLADEDESEDDEEEERGGFGETEREREQEREREGMEREGEEEEAEDENGKALGSGTGDIILYGTIAAIVATIGYSGFKIVTSRRKSGSKPSQS